MPAPSERTAPALAYLIVGGFLLVVAIVLLRGPEPSPEVVATVIGALVGAVGGPIGFYFGSSHARSHTPAGSASGTATDPVHVEVESDTAR